MHSITLRKRFLFAITWVCLGISRVMLVILLPQQSRSQESLFSLRTMMKVPMNSDQELVMHTTHKACLRSYSYMVAEGLHRGVAVIDYRYCPCLLINSINARKPAQITIIKPLLKIIIELIITNYQPVTKLPFFPSL